MTKFNQYSIETIKKYIALGATKREMDKDSFLYWAADYPLSVIPFIELGYQYPDFEPEIKQYYRIGVLSATVTTITETASTSRTTNTKKEFLL